MSSNDTFRTPETDAFAAKTGYDPELVGTLITFLCLISGRDASDFVQVPIPAGEICSDD